MSLAPVDVMEEDAADLQFPKESEILSVNAGEHTQQTIQHYRPQHYGHTNLFSCDACHTSVQEPYIKCMECCSIFCLQCFAQGAETTEHSNSHGYTIRDDNIRVFPGDNWSAREEKKFLDLMLMNGFGNWDGIAKDMKTKTANECRDHYMTHYLNGIVGKMAGITTDPYTPLIVPYLCKINSVDPPRQDLDSHNFKAMAGYRCARGDFDTPYDNSAEIVISNLDLTNWSDCDVDVGETLNCAMFQVYNNRLRERRRRYKIMKEHGLLVASRTFSWLAKYSDALGCSQTSNQSQGGKQNSGRFIALMQLLSGTAFDSIVEALQHAHDLKKYIHRLYEVRKNGITSFHGGKVFHKLRAQRMSKIRDKRAESYDNHWEWKQLLPSLASTTTNNPLSNLVTLNPGIKRKSTPLDIFDASIISPNERRDILNDLFELINDPTHKEEGLQLLGFFVKEMKREMLGSCNEFHYMQRQNVILNEYKQRSQNAMSRHVLKYATDLDEVVSLCGWYLYDEISLNQPNMEILNFFVDAMTMNGHDSGYDESTLKTRLLLLDRMWQLVFNENKLPYSLQGKLLNVHPTFFSDKLDDIVANMCRDNLDDTDLVLVKIDINYQKIVQLCQTYKNAFKIAYTNIATVMMEVRECQMLQRFLDNFLSDIKSAMKMSDFQHHYEDKLINFVLVLGETRLDDYAIARHLLYEVKKCNFLNFVILVTHFSQYLQLWHTEIN